MKNPGQFGQTSVWATVLRRRAWGRLVWIAVLVLLRPIAAAAFHQPQPGQFPPERSSRYFAGELIFMDHVNRTGQLRPDRRNDQRTDDYDRAMLFSLLPYGSIRYHGAPAELRDIPIGTHLHGEFYLDPKAAKGAAGPFNQVFLLEDDFSRSQRLGRLWKVDAVAPDKGTLTVTGISSAGGTNDAKPTVFQINRATRVWTGRGVGDLAQLAVGQSLLLNITVATLKGPGRCTDIWIDPESRETAAAQQMEVHRAYQKAHGLAGWIDAVDNGKGLVTATLFAGFDRSLTNDFKVHRRVAVLVAEDSLRCYDPVNDRMYSEVVEMNSVPSAPGGSGFQVVLRPENLLEGFRPRRVVRMLPENWPLDDFPWEEMLWPADNRVK
jgi:hypothetical protein